MHTYVHIMYIVGRVETPKGWSTGEHSSTVVPLHNDHLSTETPKGWSTGEHSSTVVPLHNDHLSTETTINCTSIT